MHIYQGMASDHCLSWKICEIKMDYFTFSTFFHNNLDRSKVTPKDIKTRFRASFAQQKTTIHCMKTPRLFYTFFIGKFYVLFLFCLFIASFGDWRKRKQARKTFNRLGGTTSPRQENTSIKIIKRWLNTANSERVVRHYHHIFQEKRFCSVLKRTPVTGTIHIKQNGQK